MILKLLFRNFLLVLCAHLVFLTPVLFFGDGFFLRRVEFPDKATQKGPPVYKRAVILLVDALSYSFAEKLDLQNVTDVEHFANKLTVFQDMLSSNEYSKKARLYKFLADPPTTTMQRIKALSTGSLSTFIEIAANFFSSEIAEDSWIYQSRAIGNGVVAMGDDTWGGLFPKDFKRAHFYPSFNVKDLDTVDNGVLEHLDEELAKKDWSVLLGHFLGVDHCGHTYGRNHPEMARKLSQMDQVIRKTLENIDQDTVFFVLGDHGMTANGDHGGDSELEVASTLFVYAPKHDFSRLGNFQKRPEPVYQTDFIPSLSLLLGWPIPFSSIGTLIEELFEPILPADQLLAAYERNSKQLAEYFDQYFEPGSSARQEIDFLYDEALKTNTPQAHKKFHLAVRATCEAAWVKFNLTLVFGGLLGQALAILVIIFMFALLNGDAEKLTFKRIFGGLLAISVPLGLLVVKVLLNRTVFNDFGLVLLLNSVLVGMILMFRNSNLAFLKRENAYLLTFLIPLLIGKFSNSYVIYEPYVVLILLVGFALTRTWRLIARLLPSLPGKWKDNLLAWPLNLQLAYTTCLLVVLRFLLGVFLSCREEHGPTCHQSSLLTPLGALNLAEIGQSNLSFRFFAAICCLLVIPMYFRHLAQQRGNLASSSFLSKLYSPGLLVISFLIIFDWLVQAAALKMGGKSSLPAGVFVIFPRLVYGAIGLIWLCLALDPLIFAQKTEQDLVAEQFDPSEIDPSNPQVMKQLYGFLKTKFDQGLTLNDVPLYVYGLGSTISTAWQLVYCSSAFLVIILLGDSFTTSILAIVIALFLFYKLEMSSTGLSLALMLHLVQTLAFYATGHHATWTHLKWQAAFVGFEQVPDFFAIPGALILTNTFAGNVVTLLSIPFFILWPVVEMQRLPKGTSQDNQSPEHEKDAECGFIREPQLLANPLARISLLFVASTALEIFCSGLAACLLRRHLMAYKIFVPRLIFAIISFAYNTVLLLVVVTVPCYVLKRLALWRASIDQPAAEQQAKSQ